MSTTTSTTRVILADSKIKYGRILVPHDGSEMSDKSLNHAVYLSKISGAEIVVLGVIEHADDIPPSALLAFIRPETPLEKAKQELRNIIERGIEQMLDERVRQCKEAGIKKVSYEIRIGKPVDEIVHLSEELNFDILVMASSRITSSVRVLGSTARRVIESIRKPVSLDT